MRGPSRDASRLKTCQVLPSEQASRFSVWAPKLFCSLELCPLPAFPPRRPSARTPLPPPPAGHPPGPAAASSSSDQSPVTLPNQGRHGVVPGELRSAGRLGFSF